MFRSSFVPLLAVSLHCHVCLLNVCFIHIVAFPETILKEFVPSILSPAVSPLKCFTFLSCIDPVNVLSLEILLFFLVQFVYKQADSRIIIHNNLGSTKS